VGGKENIPIDVRIIAATHRDLEKLIAEKQFREDLYYRIGALVVQLPPLRDRADDIPALVNYFLNKFRKEMRCTEGSMQPEALKWLKDQRWPGNVRQLENVIRQALLASRGFPIGSDLIQSVFSRGIEKIAVVHSQPQGVEALMDELLAQAKAGAELDVHARVVEEMERQLFTRAIRLAQGNQAKAARWLKMSRQTVREKLQYFGLKTSSDDVDV